MKTNVLAILFLGILYQFQFAQLQISDPSPLLSMKACSEDTFSLQIAHNSGAFSTGDTLELQVDLPSGILIENFFATGNAGIVIIDVTTDPEHAHFFITGLSGTNFLFHYSAIPSCSYFQENSSTALANQASLWYNGAAQPGLTTQPYNVSSAWLVFSPGSSLRLSHNLAGFLVPYERRFVYINTSNTPFTGDFMFRDTTEYVQGVTNLRFGNADVTHPSGASYSQLSLTLNDSTVILTGHISNLGQGDSIVIRETVVVIDCPDVIDRSVTHFNLKYGCQNDSSLCQATPLFQTAAALDPNDRPGLAMRIPDPTYYCPSRPDERVYWMINTGTGLADTAYFRLTKGLGRELSYFDTANVVMFHLVNGLEVNVPYVVKSLTYHPNSLTPSLPYKFEIASTVPVYPGDTIGVRYLEEKVCLEPADYQFNAGYTMYNIRERGWLGHPCFPTAARTNDASRTAWGEPHSIFALEQNFENHTSTMGRDEEAWFCVDNRTPLQLNMNHVYFPNEVLGVPDSMDFQIELVLDSGLGLVTDSLFLSSFQNGQDTLWYSFNIDYMPGNGVNIGTGDTAVATFRFPSYFFAANNGVYRFYGADLKKSDFYNAFLNRFSVKFKLHAFCEYAPSTGASQIKERTYLVYDRSCDPLCRIPLSEVTDGIFILCPGCILPGWNLSRFDVERINFDYEDADNNNFPDSYPLQAATNSRLKKKRVMVGDTVQISIDGFTSDGRDLLFDDIGFDFIEGQLRIQGSLLNALEFIGAEGTYSIGPNTYNFTVPATEGVFSPAKWELDLGIQKLLAYGLPSDSISRFWGNHGITIRPKFVVTQNLINGSGGDPSFSVESLDSWIYMSGDTIHPAMVDANTVHDYLRDSLTGPQRAAYLYWCTGFGGRITGIGANFSYSAASQNYSGIWGVTGLNFCYKKLRIVAWSDLGESHSNANWHHDNANQAALNSFAYEFRDFYVLDSLSFTVPADYEIERIQFRYSTLMLDSVTNKTRYVCSPDWYSPFLYPLANATVSDSVYTIYPSNYYADLTDPPANCGKFDLWRGDETKRVQVELILRMSDCQTTRDTVTLGTGYPVSSHWSSFPGVGDTVITQEITGLLDKPSAKLETQAVPVIQNTSSPNISWNLNISPITPGPGYFDRIYNGTAYNIFASFVSPSGNISISNIIRTNGANPTAPDSADGRPLWRIGGLTHTQSANLIFYANYDCATSLGIDSLFIITGWNCYDYPTDLSEVCFIDTTVVYLIPQASGLQTTLNVANVVNACDTLPYDLDLKATGLGDIGNISVRLVLPAGGELNYLQGSGNLVLGSNIVAIDPELDSLGLVWHLDSVPFIATGFDGTQASAHLTFSAKSGCGFDDEEVQLIVSAENFCGNPIGPILLSRRPISILGLPTVDSLQMDVISPPFTSCGDSSVVQLTVTNIGSKATGNYNSIKLIMAPGISYGGGSPIGMVSGDTVFWSLNSGIPIGGTQVINAVLNSNNVQLDCGTYPIAYSLNYGEEYTCDTTLCLLDVQGESGTFSLQVEKPILVLSGLNMEAVCFSAGGNLQVNVNNGANVPASNIPLQFYCLDTIGNVIQPACLIASTTIGTLPANGNMTVSAPLTGTCNDCYGMMVVIGDNNSCICLPDTLIGAIDCDTVCRNVNITCPADLTIECDQSVSPLSTGMATAVGDCGIDTIFFSDQTIPGICPLRMTILRSWFVIDEAGNRDTCLQVITLEDNSAPVLACPGNIALNNDPNVCGANVAFSATATDNCGSVSITYSLPANSFFPVGTTNVVVTATDDCGNASACDFDIAVTDNEPPVITCPADLSFACNSELPNPNTSLVTATDNCTLASIAFGGDSDNGGSGCPGDPRIINRIYTATDIYGNAANCSQTITIESSPILSITSPNAIVFPLYPDSACADISVSASGGCPPYSYTWSNGPQTSTQNVCPLTTTLYTVTVTDSEGCTTEDSVLVCALDLACTGGSNNGPSGNGQGGNGSTNGNGQMHLFVCHIPPGNPANAMTKCLPISSVMSHIGQNHGGDHLGPCGSLLDRSCLIGEAAKSASNRPQDEEIGDLSLLVYPNPSSDWIRVEIKGLTSPYDIKVVDVFGQVIVRNHMGSEAESEQLEFDLSGFSAGIYFIVAEDGKNRLVEKVLKY